ncbi:MAG: hypothetical protein E7650_01925 [Ruminococcaceae bacterium]|nr:hypothetical protein [Oscillospiraceae bacterium]
MNGAQGSPPTGENESAEREVTASTGLDDESFSALLGSIGTMAPLFRSLGSVIGAKPSPACAAREHLLLSLKPYLSPTRCEAVDYLVRIARLGDIIHSLEKGEGRS